MKVKRSYGKLPHSFVVIFFAEDVWEQSILEHGKCVFHLRLPEKGTTQMSVNSDYDPERQVRYIDITLSRHIDDEDLQVALGV